MALVAKLMLRTNTLVMLRAVSFSSVIGGGGWGRTGARLLGVAVLSFIVNVVVFLFLLFNDERHGGLQWLVVSLAVLIAPAYGWMEYRAARQRNQGNAARTAKIMAIFILVMNGVILAWVLLAAEAIRHMAP